LNGGPDIQANLARAVSDLEWRLQHMESHSRAVCLICQLGLISFPEAMKFEHRLIELMFEGKMGDVLLVFQHPPTITMGKFGNMMNVLVPPEKLGQRGIAFYDSDRGGDATFNCPGQLVIHPIMNLRLRGARAYIADLEELGLELLSEYDIVAERSPQHPGVWVNGKQIGAVGLRLSHGISMHGMSLNVNPDLEAFKVINLCGLPGRSATSIENELGHKISMSEVKQRVRKSFSKVFQVDLRQISKEKLKNLCFEQRLSQTS
jgi:lipoate-protein ligase B